MALAKTFWIKERHNPQLGIYYTACGRMSKAEARRNERLLYGYNVMLPFATQEAYEKECTRLNIPFKA